MGFVPNMRVPGVCYINKDLEGLLFDELKAFSASSGHGGFLPAVKQLANVAALPGIVQVRISGQLRATIGLFLYWLRTVIGKRCAEMYSSSGIQSCSIA